MTAFSRRRAPAVQLPLFSFRGLLLLTAFAAADLRAQDSTLRLPDNAVVDVTLRTGRLIVRGTDRSTGSVRGGGRNYQLRPSGVGIVVNERTRDRDDDGPLELDLPRNVRLVVNTSSADVDLRDLRGDVDIKTVSGDLVADNLSGRLRVDTFSGDVDVVGSVTGVRVSTISGDVHLRGVRGDVELKTTSGTLRVDGDRLTSVTAESISGDITVDGGLTDDARVQATSHSGDITLRLPGGVRAALDFTTINGELDAGGPLTLMPGEVGGSRSRRATRHYEIGNGSTPATLRIDLSTSSGDVRLVRGIRS
jgi:DUF4097 and DUF4098 domain-containing protein YvlB